MTRGEEGLRVGEERTLCILPLFHIYSLTVVMLLGFKLGAELVLHPRFDPAAAVKDIVEKKITVYMGVPTMHVALLSVPGLEKLDFFVAAPVRFGRRPAAGRPCRKRFESVIGCPIERRLGHDGDGAGWNLQPARGSKTGAAPAAFLIPARR